ncbi:hypothetical protein [Haloferula sp. BvORR071]|uniref:hypothetical protein n=1 Tax=Haloferula sp. BvORR071 TaxID=1396141 RepID=UPI00054E5FB7|nr:hypothetical protein [Haloferula sp. BvORR071]
MKHAVPYLASGTLLLPALMGAAGVEEFKAFWPASLAAGLLAIAGFGVLLQRQAPERKPCPVRVRVRR